MFATVTLGFPDGPGKEPACQCRSPKRCRFNPWVRKIPWRRKWQPTPVFLPRKFHGQKSLVGYKSMGLQRVRDDLAHKYLTTKILQKYLGVMKLFYNLIVVVITLTHIKKYFILLHVNYTSVSRLWCKLCSPTKLNVEV